MIYLDWLSLLFGWNRFSWNCGCANSSSLFGIWNKIRTLCDSCVQHELPARSKFSTHVHYGRWARFAYTLHSTIGLLRRGLWVAESTGCIMCSGNLQRTDLFICFWSYSFAIMGAWADIEKKDILNLQHYVWATTFWFTAFKVFLVIWKYRIISENRICIWSRHLRSY